MYVDKRIVRVSFVEVFQDQAFLGGSEQNIPDLADHICEIVFPDYGTLRVVRAALSKFLGDHGGEPAEDQVDRSRKEQQDQESVKGFEDQDCGAFVAASFPPGLHIDKNQGKKDRRCSDPAPALGEEADDPYAKGGDVGDLVPVGFAHRIVDHCRHDDDQRNKVVAVAGQHPHIQSCRDKLEGEVDAVDIDGIQEPLAVKFHLDQHGRRGCVEEGTFEQLFERYIPDQDKVQESCHHAEAGKKYDVHVHDGCLIPGLPDDKNANAQGCRHVKKALAEACRHNVRQQNGDEI